mmetsp:Transcript_4508/g.8778  ORF Transcript_4508/g.8778 Transcript_4508/m.8778 type:complete len:301 (+) Transcript_4508:332-1234(+)
MARARPRGHLGQRGAMYRGRPRRPARKRQRRPGRRGPLHRHHEPTRDDRVLERLHGKMLRQRDRLGRHPHLRHRRGDGVGPSRGTGPLSLRHGAAPRELLLRHQDSMDDGTPPRNPRGARGRRPGRRPLRNDRRLDRVEADGRGELRHGRVEREPDHARAARRRGVRSGARGGFFARIAGGGRAPAGNCTQRGCGSVRVRRLPALSRRDSDRGRGGRSTGGSVRTVCLRTGGGEVHLWNGHVFDDGNGTRSGSEQTRAVDHGGLQSKGGGKIADILCVRGKCGTLRQHHPVAKRPPGDYR